MPAVLVRRVNRRARVEIRERPVRHAACPTTVPGETSVLLDEATEHLIHELRGGTGDLWDLVDAVRWQPLHVIAVSAEQIVRWRTDDARAWQLVLEWLTRMDVEVNLS